MSETCRHKCSSRSTMHHCVYKLCGNYYAQRILNKNLTEPNHMLQCFEREVQWKIHIHSYKNQSLVLVDIASWCWFSLKPASKKCSEHLQPETVTSHSAVTWWQENHSASLVFQYCHKQRNSNKFHLPTDSLHQRTCNMISFVTSFLL